MRVPRRPQRAALDERMRVVERRAPSVLEVDHELRPAPLCSADDLLAFANRRREGLLDEKVLSGLGQADRDLGVGEVGGGHRDRVDAVIGRHFPPVGARAGGTVLGGDLLGPLHVDVTDDGEFRVRVAGVCLCVHLAEKARAHQGKSSLGHCRPPFRWNRALSLQLRRQQSFRGLSAGQSVGAGFEPWAD